MKKLFAIILSGLILCSFAACGQSKTSSTTATEAGKDAATTAAAAQTTTEAPLTGGYTDAASPVLTDDVKAVFNKAVEGLTGMTYEPVAYLGSQVVAGTNHLILCKAAAVTENPTTTYALLTVYEDLNGNAEITESREFTGSAAPAAQDAEEPIAGAYEEPETPVVTDDAKAALAKACETLTGAGYEAKALLGTQVVAGTNHLFLCKTAPVVPGAAETYALVTVYEDLKGNASVTDVQNCEAKAPAAPDDGSMVAGGVTEAQTPEVTPDAKAALDKACQGPDGAKYEVKALLGTQVVAGTNYTLLCKITPVVPNASSHYAIVKVYEKPDGSAEISETFDFTPSNNA